MSVSLAGVGFLPLFAGPSYEFALATGLLGPSLCGVAVALEVVRQRPIPGDAFRRGIMAGLAYAALAAGIALLHGLRVGFCDFWGEWVLFALGPAVGLLTGGSWGALAGLGAATAGQGRAAALLAVLFTLAGPAVCVFVGLMRYYTGPMVFAFDPFVGYFAGTLYDTVLDGTERLLSYRAGTLGYLLGAAGLCALLQRGADPAGTGGGLTFRFRGRSAALVLGSLGALLGVLITYHGPELGHVQTAATLRQALGQVAQSKRCEVVYAASIVQRDAHALARECDAHVEQLEKYFETQGPPRITVYLFSSSGQRARLMGARDVSLAKPWRNEIYLEVSGYPHPILGHELAHVLAGSFAKGPFKVAGPLGGWFPDPGRIEGFAEAAAPREYDDLSLMEWARVMQDIKLLPPLDRVFKLTFFGENSSKAYTVAGAFIAWLKDTRGAAVLRDWYAGTPIEVAAQKTLTELEAEFIAALEQISVDPNVMEVARARFDRPAVFGRRCPRQVDALMGDASRALGSRETARAATLYEQVLKLDPGNFNARLGLGHCAYRRGELERAATLYREAAADTAFPQALRARAEERAGDTALLLGNVAEARELYSAAAQALVQEDAQRNLDVRLWVEPKMDKDHPARKALVAFLIGDPLLGSDALLSGAELARWSATEPELGLSDYLLGKNYFQRGYWNEAAEALDRALDRKLPLPRVKHEALRTRMFVACALGQTAVAQRMFTQHQSEKGILPQRKAGVQRFGERCGLR